MTRSVFVSKPSTRNLNEQQAQFWSQLQTILHDRGLNTRSLGETDFSNVAPMGAVRRLMLECHGTVILGLKQTLVIDGIEKERTSRQSRLRRVFLPTAWNQIEAGMAFALNLPTLIIREEGVEGGVFDVGSTDRFIHQVSLPTGDWLHSSQFLHPLNEWFEEVLAHSAARPNSP